MQKEMYVYSIYTPETLQANIVGETSLAGSFPGYNEYVPSGGAM